MKLYTYSAGQLNQGALLQGAGDTAVRKTCSININLPYDCDAESFINKLKDRDCADILLYGVATLIPGDSVSSVCPENSVMVVCEDPLHVENIQDSCLEVYVNEKEIAYLLFDGSELLDTTTGKYIKNSSGKLKLEKESAIPEEETDYSDIVVIL